MAATPETKTHDTLSRDYLRGQKISPDLNRQGKYGSLTDDDGNPIPEDLKKEGSHQISFEVTRALYELMVEWHPEAKMKTEELRQLVAYINTPSNVRFKKKLTNRVLDRKMDEAVIRCVKACANGSPAPALNMKASKRVRIAVRKILEAPDTFGVLKLVVRKVFSQIKDTKGHVIVRSNASTKYVPEKKANCELAAFVDKEKQQQLRAERKQQKKLLKSQQRQTCAAQDKESQERKAESKVPKTTTTKTTTELQLKVSVSESNIPPAVETSKIPVGKARSPPSDGMAVIGKEEPTSLEEKKSNHLTLATPLEPAQAKLNQRPLVAVPYVPVRKLLEHIARDRKRFSSPETDKERQAKMERDRRVAEEVKAFHHPTPLKEEFQVKDSESRDEAKRREEYERQQRLEREHQVKLAQQREETKRREEYGRQQPLEREHQVKLAQQREETKRREEYERQQRLERERQVKLAQQREETKRREEQERQQRLEYERQIKLAQEREEAKRCAEQERQQRLEYERQIKRAQEYQDEQAKLREEYERQEWLERERQIRLAQEYEQEYQRRIRLAQEYAQEYQRRQRLEHERQVKLAQEREEAKRREEHHRQVKLAQEREEAKRREEHERQVKLAQEREEAKRREEHERQVKLAQEREETKRREEHQRQVKLAQEREEAKRREERQRQFTLAQKARRAERWNELKGQIAKVLELQKQRELYHQATQGMDEPRFVFDSNSNTWIATSLLSSSLLSSSGSTPWGAFISSPSVALDHLHSSRFPVSGFAHVPSISPSSLMTVPSVSPSSVMTVPSVSPSSLMTGTSPDGRAMNPWNAFQHAHKGQFTKAQMSDEYRKWKETH